MLRIPGYGSISISIFGSECDGSSWRRKEGRKEGCFREKESVLIPSPHLTLWMDGVGHHLMMVRFIRTIHHICFVRHTIIAKNYILLIEWS